MGFSFRATGSEVAGHSLWDVRSAPRGRRLDEHKNVLHGFTVELLLLYERHNTCGRRKERFRKDLSGTTGIDPH